MSSSRQATFLLALVASLSCHSLASRLTQRLTEADDGWGYWFGTVVKQTQEPSAQPIATEATVVEEPVILEVEPSVVVNIAVATSASLEPDLCVGEACKCGPGMTGVQPFCVAIVDATAAPPAPTQPPTLVYAALPSNVSESNVVVEIVSTPPPPPPPTTPPDYGGCPSKDPCFLSQSQNLKVVIGEDAVFTCEVGNLGSHFVAWMKKDALLTMGSMKYTSNKRISLTEDGAKLVVSSVINTDADTYLCQINSEPPKKLYHSLEILVPPSAGILPASELIARIEGEDLSLTCETGGNPAPKVTWAKEGGLLPNGDNVFYGAELAFPSLSRDDSGVYVCTASNGVRQPAIARTEVRVHFRPTLQPTTVEIVAREGGETSLECSAIGDPPPKIAWTQLGDNSSTPIENSQRHQITVINVGQTTRSRLRVLEMTEADFGLYKCNASNILGVDEDSIEVSGRPGQVVITSGRDCIIDTECSLTFKVTSLNAVTEYHVRVREFNQTAGEYGNLTLISITPSAELNQSIGDDYMQEVLIQDLNPSTQYEVDVYAHTKFGAGPASRPHYLTTNYEGATYPPPPTTTTPEPPTTVPPTTTTIPTTTEVATTTTSLIEPTTVPETTVVPVDESLGSADKGISTHGSASLLLVLGCAILVSLL